MSQPNFKVDIRNAPIAEEDGDASAAMANVANTLRMVRSSHRTLYVDVLIIHSLLPPDGAKVPFVDVEMETGTRSCCQMTKHQ